MTVDVDLVGYLTSKGHQVHRAAGDEVTAHCWWCADGDPKGKGRLYLNTDSWLYDCKRCGAAGNRKTLLEWFGDEDEWTPAGPDPMLRRRILTEAAELAHEMLLANAEKLDYLLDRGIAPELIVSEKLGYVPKNIGLSEMLPMRSQLKGYSDLIAAGLVTPGGKEFLSDCITIPYFSHGTVVQIRAKFIDGKYLTAGGDHTRLHNADAIHGAHRVLITEGELDDIAVRSQILASGERTLTDLAVVGLPGAGSWPEGLVESLAGAKRVFVGLDPDETGDRFADKLIGEIGNKARKVRLPGGEPKTDWTDFFKPRTDRNPNGGHDWRDLRALLSEADLEGKQMFSITDVATKWARRQEEAPGFQLGWPSLDAILRPGIKPGQVVVPLAMTGTGKSVFLSNIIHNLSGQHVLACSLEMTAPEVFEHLRRIHRFWNPDAGAEHLAADYSRLRIVEQNRLGRGDLERLIEEYTEDVGHRPEILIVDYLQYYARGFRAASMYDRVSDAIMEVKAVSKEQAVATIIPSQVNRGAERGKPLLLTDARDAGTIEETADFIPSIFRPDQLVTREASAPVIQSGDFRIQLLKSRHGGVDKQFNLRLSMMSLAITDVVFDKRGSARVEQENQLYRQGVHYDDYRAMTPPRRNDGIGQGALL